MDKVIAGTRQDKNEYYLSVAYAIAMGSSCPPGKQHGCVAVKNMRIVSTGYNGVPTGHPHCGLDCPLDVYKRKHGRKRFDLCPAVHSEVNCIITAAMLGTNISGAVFYVTKRPCGDCLKALRNCQLAGVVYPDELDNHCILHGPLLLKEEILTYGKKA